jgi:hypothetical protein
MILLAIKLESTTKVFWYLPMITGFKLIISSGETGKG